MRLPDLQSKLHRNPDIKEKNKTKQKNKNKNHGLSAEMDLAVAQTLMITVYDYSIHALMFSRGVLQRNLGRKLVVQDHMPHPWAEARGS